jgi:hypothetical protein
MTAATTGRTLAAAPPDTPHQGGRPVTTATTRRTLAAAPPACGNRMAAA